MASSMGVEFSDDGSLVYFKVNMKELFRVNLETPGVKSALNEAFKASKELIPVDTGLMLKSYTMDELSNNSIICYFDRKKIIGQTRKGYKVKNYYPSYLKDYASRLTWLDLIIKRFYNTLIKNIKQINKKKNNKPIEMDNFKAFWILFLASLEKKKKEAKKELQEQKGGK